MLNFFLRVIYYAIAEDYFASKCLILFVFFTYRISTTGNGVCEVFSNMSHPNILKPTGFVYYAVVSYAYFVENLLKFITSNDTSNLTSISNFV